MHVFLTGATGFIGSAIIPELISAGHTVLGQTRSDAGAKALAAMGIESHFGTLEDPDSLRAGAAKADAVIHCAYDHDFSKYTENGVKGVMPALTISGRFEPANAAPSASIARTSFTPFSVYFEKSWS